ncbi:MAG: glucose-6-phosphate isomerase [Acholeplasmatales bacterium]|jgi:glucose-6-phosphate isomerase|nr:glucose-6-phosphate isomerase [Acholeplasmatales bacterium]
MEKIRVDIEGLTSFITKEEMNGLQKKVDNIHKKVHLNVYKKVHSIAGGDFLGWVELPIYQNAEELKLINLISQAVLSSDSYLVVIGIGGSYLGAKAAIELFKHPYQESKVIFLGYNTSSEYLSQTLEFLADKNFYLNVISKSGTTLEPALAFRAVKELMIKKYGSDYASRVIATTDKKRGSLFNEAINLGYKRLVVEDNIGGRYSVLTGVGLLPMACSGIEIEELLRGAKDAWDDLSLSNINSNFAYKYAVSRYLLYKQKKTTEILVNYDSSLNYISEWAKQLFCESEGKEHKGILVTSVSYTTDLHSLGQYVQDGKRNIFETTIYFEEDLRDIKVVSLDHSYDGLDELAGLSFKYITNQARLGVLKAHLEGGVPNIVIQIPKKNPYYLGYLFYFLEKACMMSAYLLGVNPFNQPGVESYKKEMFALLGLKK